MTSRKTADKKKPQLGQLRIVAGNWRSRLLQIADVPGLQPTSVRIRETLFNWLAPRIHGAKCLDLCAGTGALGLEALSRGASRVVFVERSAIAAKYLGLNIASLEASGAELHNVDASKYLQESTAEAFDVVFLDPPFADDLHDELCRLLATEGWLAADARVYIEMDGSQPEVRVPENWRVLKNKTAGKVRYLMAAVSD
ncbi:MAG: 16S rRNA (guanine(966)-N(2))-methyltransferase RsmD [Woeseiaceae bacterium]|nr:16S rRNA (guanine(966)-N(2))-methyltransferase RsmD [Woeseiaceae bacterium]